MSAYQAVAAAPQPQALATLNPPDSAAPAQPSEQVSTTPTQQILDNEQEQPSVPQRQQTPILKDDRTFNEGDFTLVSSDNTCFTVQSYHLLSASAVFRDASTLPKAPGDDRHEVIFTDPDMETAAVVRRFLRLVVGGDCGLPYHEDVLFGLVRFLRKYECTAALCSLLWSVRALVSEKIHPDAGEYQKITVREAFIVGALADDVTTCMAAMRQAREKDPDDECLGLQFVTDDDAQHENVLDPCSWSLCTWKMVPYNYLWALARSAHHISKAIESACILFEEGIQYSQDS